MFGKRLLFQVSHLLSTFSLPYAMLNTIFFGCSGVLYRDPEKPGGGGREVESNSSCTKFKIGEVFE